jgi:hypothetical protein
MIIDPKHPELADDFAAFGRELLLLENPSFGAKEIPFGVLIDKAKSWFASQDTILRGILCTPANQVRPEVTAGVNLTGIVATAIRAHYGDRFPAPSAAGCLVSYGIVRYCAARPPAEPEATKKT